MYDNDNEFENGSDEFVTFDGEPTEQELEFSSQVVDYLTELNWYEHEHNQAIARNDHKAARYWGLRWHKLNNNEPLPY